MKRNYLYGFTGLISLVLFWQAGTLLLAQHIQIATDLSPLQTLNSLYALSISGEIFPHIWASVQRIIVGLTVALLCGIPLGLALGLSKTLEMCCTPAFQFLRMISPLSWMPIVVMFLGVGDLPVYFLIAFAAIWSLILSTASGVKSIDPQWFLLSRSLAASKRETLCHIIVPAITGHILTGLRVSLGIAWVVLVPCEMLGVNEGLGYFILDTRDRLAYSELMAAVIVIGLIGWGLDSLLLLGIRTK
ncbi:ABC transporter permease [Glaesserella parasuis]|uniref:ABC transporter permease n=1 Tax=Glaesserella parasuis TaxID=738 RepID=UPI00049FF219|nr:ABC transporter permease [Glaesserella parasuis]KDD79065.1 ABC transporter permease [Glaesserella parasuis ST4-1]MCT8775558.1 ABC transporter permease [Glaesserella parasuis]